MERLKENSKKFMEESGQQTVYGRIRSILNGAGLEGELRDKIWAECVINVTYLSNIISTKLTLKCTFEYLFSKRPSLHDNLKLFGKVGDVITKERCKQS
jgi:hypothetical protein